MTEQSRIEKLMKALDQKGFDTENIVMNIVMNFLTDQIAPEAKIEYVEETGTWEDVDRLDKGVVDRDVVEIAGKHFPEVDLYEADHSKGLTSGVEAAIFLGNLTERDVLCLMQEAYDKGHERGLGF